MEMESEEKSGDIDFFGDVKVVIEDNLSEFINRFVTGQDYSSELDLELKYLAEQIYCKKDSDFLFSAVASRAILLPHQLGAVARAVCGTANGILLADAVGLGKTIEAGMIIKEFIIRGAQRILILVPPHLLNKWCDELNYKLSLSFEIYKAADIQRRLDISNKIKIICSIHTAKRDINLQHLIRYKWDLVVIDEAHHLRNSYTKTYKLGYKLVKSSRPYVVLITATPLQNNINELYTILSLIDNRLRQLSTYGLIQQNSLYPQLSSTLKEILQNVMVRNTRKDLQYLLDERIINNLPNNREIRDLLVFINCERDVKTILIKLSERWMNIYEYVTSLCRELYNNDKRAAILVTMLAQRMVCSSIAAIRDFLNRRMKPDEVLEKMALIEMVESSGTDIVNDLGYETGTIYNNENIGDEISEKDIALFEIIDKLNSNEKVLIFTEFRKTQEHLINILERRYNQRVYILNGDLSEEEKRKSVDQWRENGRIMVSTDVGAEGLDMQFCGTVINYDLPWNPMKIEQRIGRIHRIGQTRKVVRVFNLCAKETIEEYVLETLHNKIGIFERIVGDIENILGQLLRDRDYSNIESTIAKIILESNNRDELVEKLKQQIGNRIEIIRKQIENNLNEIDRRVWQELDLSVINAILRNNYIHNLIDKVSYEEKLIERLVCLHFARKGIEYQFENGIIISNDGRRLTCRRNVAFYSSDVELISLTSPFLLRLIKEYVNKPIFCKVLIKERDQREEYLKEIIRNRTGKTYILVLINSSLRINYLDRIHYYEKVTPYLFDIDTYQYDEELSDNFFNLIKRDLYKNYNFPKVNVDNIKHNLLLLLNRDIKEKLSQIVTNYKERFEFDLQLYEELISRKFNLKIEKVQKRLEAYEEWLEALRRGWFYYRGGPEELVELSPGIRRLISRRGGPRREDIPQYIRILEREIQSRIRNLNQRKEQELENLRIKLEKVKRPEVNIRLCAIAFIKIE